MASKYTLLNELLAETVEEVTSSADNWMSFLSTASWMYKYSLEEQLLIYAQKPTARACATYDDWNTKYHRWVKRYSKGIALPTENGRVKYVFDMADTGGHKDRPLRLWTFKSIDEIDYTAKSVIDKLEDHYGEVNEVFFNDSIIAITHNIIEDNVTDYFSNLLRYHQDSQLEHLEEYEIKTLFIELIHSSILFQVLERLEIQEYHFYYEGLFDNISLFDTPETFFQLGQAIKDMSEDLISHIVVATKAVVRENKISTFAKTNELKENKGEDERSVENEQHQISSSRRLSNPQSDSRETSSVREIWTDEIELSENKSTRSLSSVESEESVEPTSIRDSGTSESDVRNNDGAENPIDERGYSKQRNTSIGVGTNDESTEERSGGNSASRSNLQLNLDLGDLGGVEEEKSIPPFDINDLPTILRSDDMFKNGIKREDVIEFYKTHDHFEERRTFLEENIFDGTFAVFKDFEHYDLTHIGYFLGEYENPEKRIKLFSGSYLNPKTESYVEFNLFVNTIAELIEKEEYLLSPYQKFTVIQQHYEQSRFNRDVVRIILTHTEVYQYLPSEIIKTLSKLETFDEKLNYIPTIFSEGITTFEVDGVPLGYEKLEDQLFLFTGEHDNPRASSTYQWETIVRDIQGLILSRYFAPDIQLPTQEEQQNAVYHSIEEFQNGNYFSQQEIDAILIGGSNVVDNKFRIYEILSKNGNSKDDIAFLKKEYGEGGSSPKVGYISESHNSKGITISKGFIGKEDIKYTLIWSYVRKRLKTLISLNRYLSEKEEKEYYKYYLVDKAKVSITKDSSTEKDTINDENSLKEYQYHLGDTVYIGINEFEVIGVGDTITLQDVSFPLFVEPYAKIELDELISENPLNQHLLRPVLTTDNSNNNAKAHEIDEKETKPVVLENPWKRCFEKSIELLLKDINQSFYSSVLRNRDTTEDEAMDMIQESVDNYVSDEMEPIFMGLYYMDSDFKKVVLDELFDKTYNDVIDTNDVFDKIAYLEKHYEEDVLDSVLFAVGIEDIDVQIDDFGDLVASNEEITWRNGELYDFILNDVIGDYENNKVISEGYYNSLLYYSDARNKDSVKQVESLPVVEQQEETIPIEKENYRITDSEFQVGTTKERYHNNVTAIKLLFLIEKENRYATKEEQDILAKYVGWGGLADAFDDSKPSWVHEYHEIKSLLSEEEYASAKESTLTAFYTSPVVIGAMYQAIENMGFRYGNILEPSCATGNFVGAIPDSLLESKVYGVELDSISGRIAQKLYPNSNIAVSGYENVNLPDSFFDVVIGNIPFGQFKVSDKRYDKLNYSIHDYFFAKTLDKVRPKGIIAFVTSRYTMDKANASVRKYINECAEFIGAIRLPNNAFKDSAGTKVVSDIIFLQKRDRPMLVDNEWLYTEQDHLGNVINSYFMNHPEMVLGTISTTKAMYGRETLDVVPFENITLEESLQNAIQNLHAEVEEYYVEDSLDSEEEIESIPADPDVKNYSYTIHDDDIYYRENSTMRKINVTATARNRIIGLIEIRESVRELIHVQTEDYSNETIQQEQQKLNAIYDSFTAKYGLINSRGNSIAFRDDSSYFLLASLELLNEDGTLNRKADMFTKRTIRKKEVVTTVETAIEALPISLSEKGKVDIDYMSLLCNKPNEEVIKELKGLVYKIPNALHKDIANQYVTADEYLSGNIREKLEIAELSLKIDSQYQEQVDALKLALPKPLTASEISVRIGATWIPPEEYQAFVFELLGTSYYNQGYIQVSYSNATDKWNIKNKTFDRGNVKAEKTYGTNRVNAYQLIEDCLNLKSRKIYDQKYDEDGNKIAVLNKKETMIAQQKQDVIKDEFKNWIWKESDRRERLSNTYNALFNSIRPREFDGSHLQFPNMNPEIKLRQHQLDAVARTLYSNNVLLAHVVGAGKTFTMIAASMELKRLGLSNKPMFVVPNHLVNQWGSDFLQLYPSSNILVARKQDFQKDNRKRFCSRIATGDYDAVIISHSMFEKIPMSIVRQMQQIEEEINVVINAIAELKASQAENFTVKQMMRTQKSLEHQLNKLNDTSRKDDVICFEELGVDRIFVDEAHNYKNLFLYTKMTNVAGLSQSQAQKSSDLYMKCRYLDELTGNKGTVFATGTPISNSMAEMYTMQRYLQYDTLRKLRLENFDSWASTFGETVNAIELTPEGTGYRMKTRFAKFYNLPELMSIFKEVADIKTADMLNLPVPKAHYHTISVKPSEIQKEIVQSLAERADRIRNRLVETYIDNMLKITNDGRKLALDQRLINDMLPEYENSKVNECIQNVKEIYEQTKQNKSTQLLFCDISTPRQDTFNIYNEVLQKLLEYGIPEKEIEFIHNANSDAKKSELFQKVRSGEVRILLGSTFKMGAGTNVQTLLIASHDLDCPWRPSDLEQRSGRIIRQGNTNSDVHIYRYVTEGTFDAYLYQLVENKQKFISQIMTSKSPVRVAEDCDDASLSYAEIKALASGNPLIKEKMDLDIQVGKLRLEKANYLSQKYELEDSVIKYYPRRIENLKNSIKQIELDLSECKLSEEFSGMKILGIDYSEKSVAGSALLLACKNIKDSNTLSIGYYNGFKMSVKYSGMANSYQLYLENHWNYAVDIGGSESGNLTRIDNVIKSIPDILEKTKIGLSEVEKQLENAKEEVAKPFSKENELSEKSQRLSELDKELDIGKSEDELSDEISLEETKKSKEYSR